jgi:phosphoglycolate phosphatase-like HAD superfamily hydrolase
MTKVLIFDCDGVLGDTERDGHLVAFNRMWREQGVNWQWSLEQYAEKVKIGGGKERMFSLGRDDDFRAVYDVPASEEEWWETVAAWHKRKSAIYKELIASGAIPGRPGVKRLAEAALDDWLDPRRLFDFGPAVGRGGVTPRHGRRDRCPLCRRLCRGHGQGEKTCPRYL